MNIFYTRLIKRGIITLLILGGIFYVGGYYVYVHFLSQDRLASYFPKETVVYSHLVFESPLSERESSILEGIASSLNLSSTEKAVLPLVFEKGVSIGFIPLQHSMSVIVATDITNHPEVLPLLDERGVGYIVLEKPLLKRTILIASPSTELLDEVREMITRQDSGIASSLPLTLKKSFERSQIGSLFVRSDLVSQVPFPSTTMNALRAYIHNKVDSLSFSIYEENGLISMFPVPDNRRRGDTSLSPLQITDSTSFSYFSESLLSEIYEVRDVLMEESYQEYMDLKTYTEYIQQRYNSPWGKDIQELFQNPSIIQYGDGAYLIAVHINSDQDKLALEEEIKRILREYVAITSAQVEEVLLKDGSVGKELRKNTNLGEFIRSNDLQFPVWHLSVGDDEVSYGISDGMVIVSNSHEAITSYMASSAGEAMARLKKCTEGRTYTSFANISLKTVDLPPWVLNVAASLLVIEDDVAGYPHIWACF